jgi:hypothetical protein
MEKGNERNRLAGVAYERQIVDTINSSGLFPEVGRSAELDKAMDAKKVDIIPVPPTLLQDFAYRIQAKTSTKHVSYAKLLRDIEEGNPDGIAVVLHKKTKRVENDRFLTEGTYAVLSQEDFFDIIEELERYKQGYKVFNESFDSFPDAKKETLHKRLLKLRL